MKKLFSLKLSKTMKTTLYAIAVVIAIVLLYSLLTSKKIEQTGVPLGDNEASRMYAPYEGFTNEIKGKLMLFHADWCPHFKEYEKSGTFDKISKDKRLAHLSFEKIDVDQQADVAAKYGVPSFPTLVVTNSKGEKVGTFDGDRNDIDEVIKFVNTKIQG